MRLPGPGQVDTVVRFAADHPFLVFLVAAFVGLIFFFYFLIRRSILAARQGYDDRTRER
jgi:hypothetical protein